MNGTTSTRPPSTGSAVSGSSLANAAAYRPMPPGGRWKHCSRLRATRMIRLLTIQPVAERGGSDQALVRMLRSLPPAEFECHVVVPAEPPLRAEYETTGAAVHIVVLRLVRLIRELDIDVVHSNSLHSWYGWAAAALTRTPHVWHAREIVVQSDRALTVERFLTKHFATRVVCMSTAIADQLPGASTIV